MSDFLQRSSAGSFYVNAGTETVVDPFGPPLMQNQLLDQLRSCDQLVQLDFRYAKIVQGASKMPWNMVWAARNQDEPVTDADLAELRDLAWNEIIKKRYLPSLSGTATVGETTASMLEIVRDMNLQRRKFQIMGLHEQVEACEIHLVLQLCQAGILFSDRYRVMANRFRRHEKLFEAFGLAVGAFVCASAPFTLGSGMARYERDLQYEYRKNATALFVWVLQQNMAGLDSTAILDEDYVARISRLIVVWPDDDDGRKKKKRIGFEAPKKDDSGDGGSARINMLLDAVASAQGDADKARADIALINTRIEGWQKNLDDQIEIEKADMRGLLAEKVAETKNELRDVVSRKIEEIRTQMRLDRGFEMNRIDAQITDILSRLSAVTVSSAESRIQPTAVKGETGPEDTERRIRERLVQTEGEIRERLIKTEADIKQQLAQTEREFIERRERAESGMSRPGVSRPADGNKESKHTESENVSMDDLLLHRGELESMVSGMEGKMEKMIQETLEKMIQETLETFREEIMETVDSPLTESQIQAAIQSDEFMNTLRQLIHDSMGPELARQRRAAIPAPGGQAAGVINDPADILARLQNIEELLQITPANEPRNPLFDQGGPPDNAQFSAPPR